MNRISRLFRLLTLGITAAWLVGATEAQELVAQPTPFTVLLDFASLRHPAAPKQPLPIWLESVQIVPPQPKGESAAMGLPEQKQAPHTIFRLRLRAMPGLNDQLLLRLFFDDRANAHPVVSAWSETGDCRFTSAPLGAGLELPASETVLIKTQGVDYLEIEVPGDGSTIRQALLATLKKETVHTALDFATAPAKDSAEPVADPFGKAAPRSTSENDTYLFGRVRATLEAGVIKLQSASPIATGTAAVRTSVTFEFNLEAAPLLASVGLELLNADPLAPLQASVNGKALGPVAVQFPDLADPAYVGAARAYESLSFRYSDWVRGQWMIPGAALRAGSNTVTLQLPAGAHPAAIRAIELQLKQNWRILSYNLEP